MVRRKIAFVFLIAFGAFIIDLTVGQQAPGLGQACVTSEGDQGICSTATSCLSQFDTITELQNSGCNTGDGGLGLCCPTKITPRATRRKPNDIGPLPRFSIADTLDNVVLPEINENLIRDAGESGVNTILGRASLERNLQSQGILINSGTSEAFHQAFFGNSKKAEEVAKDGFAFLEATKKLAEELQLNARQGSDGLRKISGVGTNLRCPEVPSCSPNYPFRTLDGSCNNVRNPEWGKSFRAFDRVLRPNYVDGINLPRQATDGGPLPSPRTVSSTVAKDGNRPNPIFTHLMMQFGQFIDHDMTLLVITKATNGIRIRCCGDELDRNPDLRHPECFQIPIQRNDPFFSKHNERCMEFVRSAAAPPSDCKLGPRQQINQITSYLDASMIYGNTEEQAHELRKFENGRLKVTKLGDRELLPLDKENVEECNRQRTDQFCFKAGDERVNEQIDLTVLHIIWLREHNRIVGELKSLNPHWDDERLYQEGRKIVGALFQHITYNEFLRFLLGNNVMKIFDILPTREGYSSSYDPELNPTVFNAFGTAAFRVGHTMVQSNLNIVSSNGRRSGLPLSEAFNNPFRLYQSGIMDGLFRGLTVQPAQSVDSFVSPELTTRLFKPNGIAFGLDLVSLNIQRGRDHGIPSYNEFRDLCGLRKLTSFEDLYSVMPIESVERIKRAGYRDVNDIDLFIAGISEKPYQGSMMGPTFSCLIAGQFTKVKNGDRFFYDNGGDNVQFTPDQLRQIKKASLARIACDNADNINSMQPIPFLQAGVWNSRISCNSQRIPRLDLSHWRETNTGPQTTTKKFISEGEDIDDGFKQVTWNF